MVNGGGGNDVLRLFGTSGNDKAVIYPGAALLEHDAGHVGFDFSAVSVETIHYEGNGGAADLAFLFDSAGDDLFLAGPGGGSMAGAGYANSVADVDSINGIASGGTNDQAYLVDSAFDDDFSASPTVAGIGRRGLGPFATASGFDLVVATASAGGFDRAFLSDSAGDDLFDARPGVANFSRMGAFVNRALGFEAVSASSLQGGTDSAVLIDSPGDDTLVSRGLQSFLQGGGFISIVDSFESLSVVASQGGFDRAFLEDTAGADLFTGAPGQSTLQALGLQPAGTALTRTMVGFDVVSVQALHGGADVADLFGTSGNDTFIATPTGAAFAAGVGPAAALYVQTFGFETVNARAQAGADNRALLTGGPGADLFFARGPSGTLSRAGFSTFVTGFQSVHLAGGGGLNTLNAAALAFALTHDGTWTPA